MAKKRTAKCGAEEKHHHGKCESVTCKFSPLPFFFLPNKKKNTAKVSPLSQSFIFLTFFLLPTVRKCHI